MFNSINTNTCKSCKLCIEVCPCNIISINDNNEVHFIKEREHICIECGQCMAICSTKSVQLKNFLYDKNFKDLPDNQVDYERLSSFYANRRSIRNFKNKPVSNELLKKIIYTLDYAPFGASPNKVEITVVNNRKIIEKSLPFIVDFLDNIVKWIENPFISYMIKKKEGLETFNTLKNHLYPIAKQENYKLKYGDRITRDAPAIIIFHANKGAEEHTDNSIIYATYAMLAAHSLGLGVSMISIVPAAINKLPEVKKIYEIPEQNEAIISLIVGYPKYKYQRAVKRPKTNIKWIN